MKYLIVGASSGLGREIAYSFAKRKNDLILISRDERDLLSIASDLKNKFDVNINTSVVDFTDIDQVKKIISNNKIIEGLDGALFPIGLMFEKDDKNLDQSKIHKILYANFLSIVFLIAELIKIFSEKNFLIIGFGSVSGLLGRKINVHYAAAKRALESYFESLAFQNKKNNLKIHFYILGYLNTTLSFGKKLILPKGDIKKLAEIVFKNREKEFLKIYYPLFWNLFVFLLKIIPLNLLINLKKFFKL